MKVYGFPESSREGAGVLRRPKEAQKYSVDSMGFKVGLTGCWNLRELKMGRRTRMESQKIKECLMGSHSGLTGGSRTI